MAVTTILHMVCSPKPQVIQKTPHLSLNSKEFSNDNASICLAQARKLFMEDQIFTSGLADLLQITTRKFVVIALNHQ